MKLLFIKMLKYLFVPFGMIFSLIKGRRNKIVFLMYHRVNDKVLKEISIPVDNFLWQMEYLKKKGYKVISMDEAVMRIKDRDIKDKYIVLTFDDGYEDFYKTTYPILKSYGYPAIIYIVPGYVESSRVFWWDEDMGESPLMSWNQISELSTSELVTVGSHTLNHYDLDKLEYRKLSREISLSKQILEKKLGSKIRHFAYPRGIYTKAAEETVKALYETGVLIFDGREASTDGNIDDLMKLKRIPVQRSDGRWLFNARIKEWLVLEEVAKKLLSKY